MCVILFFPPDLLPHFLRKQLLTASADGISASHVKAKIPLMTGQPRSSSGLSPPSAACKRLHTIPTLSGRSTHRIPHSRYSTQVTSLALLPRLMLRAAHKYPTESVRLFARTSRRQVRAWPSLPLLTTHLCRQRVEARVRAGGVHRLVAQSAPAHRLSSHWPLRHRVHPRASACLVAQIYAHGPSHSTSRRFHHQTTSLRGIQVP